MVRIAHFFDLWLGKNEYAGSSLHRQTWRKFHNDKLSMVAAGIILIFTCIAILGYLITPDDTPFANRQLPEIALKKPGFRVQMLKVMKDEQIRRHSLIMKMIHGQESSLYYIPINHYRLDNQYLYVIGYSADTSSARPEERYGLEEIAYQVDEQVFLLGTDRFGRDILSQLILGTRVSLAVGLISVLISLIVGVFIGAAGGFFRGRVDDFVMWLINVVWSIPTLLLVIAITFALGKGFWQVFIAVGFTTWVEVARISRGQILSIREKEFIEAGRALGFSNFRLILRHILPNIMGPVIVIAAANFASAILIESGLSFLGIGVQPPVPSWGMMIRENYSYIILDKAYLAVFPGLAIMLMVLSFMIVGNGLRDAMDIRISEKKG
jgi:peptide/nickel transport system permease protein